MVSAESYGELSTWHEPRRILDPERIVRLQHVVDHIFVHRLVGDYIVRLVLATRRPAEYHMPELAPVIEVGASPRATLGLVGAARALAFLRGRDYVLPADVQDVALDVIQHRLVLTFDAIADGAHSAGVVDHNVRTVPPPRPVWREEQSGVERPDFQ
jgi:MoxR-like ATPase